MGRATTGACSGVNEMAVGVCCVVGGAALMASVGVGGLEPMAGLNGVKPGVWGGLGGAADVEPGA